MRSLGALSLLLCWAACHPAPRTGAVVGAQTLHGTVRLADGTQHGKLAIAWLTAEEGARWDHHDVHAQDVVELIHRFTVEGPLELGVAPRPYVISAPRDARPIAVLDPGAGFFPALFGQGGYLGLAAAGGTEITVRFVPRHPGRACEGPRLQAIFVDDPEVRGQLGNDPHRRFCAHLPRGYAESTKRYPVVLVLPGFGSGDMAYFGGKRALDAAADTIADQTGRELILVGVDTATKTGSTYLVDSPLTGRFDHFLAGPALAAIDAALRTLPGRQGHALLGHSTGGFNAVSYGLRHPTLFGVIGASSPDGLDLERWLFDEHHHARPLILAWTRLEAQIGWPGQMLSYAADWSPLAGERIEWPFDLRTGAPTRAWSRWRAASPAVLVEAAETTAAFTDRIFISVGEADEFGLLPPARAFADQLSARGMNPAFSTTAGGHFEKAGDRMAAGLRYIAMRLDAAR